MNMIANRIVAIVALGFALPVRAADIVWIDDANARGTEASPIDMYNAAKWNDTLPSSSHTPFFTDADMTYVTNTCADAETTAIGSNVAINGDFTFLGDYYYTGSLLTPYAKSGLRDTVIVKKGNWSLNNFEPGHRPNISLLFRNASGNLTVRGLQDIKVALQSGAFVTIENDSGDWTIPYGFYLGNASSTRTAVYWRGGNMDVASTADKFFMLGSGQNSTNEFYMTGGALTTHSWFLIGGNASTTDGCNYFEISNATVSQTQRNRVFIGYKSGGHNELCVKAGGVFNARNDIVVGQDNSGCGILTVDGGEVNVPNDVTIANTAAASSVALKGGRLAARQVAHGSGTGAGTLAFDGGTLQANQAYTLIAASDRLAVTVGANGGTIDCAGFAVTIEEDLDNATGETGSMTFTGTDGTITLNGALNYTGRTCLGDRTRLTLKDAAMKSAILSRGLTIVKPVGASPKGTYTLLTCADGTAWTSADIPSITLGDGLAGATLFVEDGAMKIEVTKETQTWAGAANTSLSWGGANWSGGATWDDGNDAVFATDGAIASVDATATATSVTFSENATITGPATLAPGTVSVLAEKEATINAATAGALEKTGAGTLTLGASRSDATTLSEGTLVMDGSDTTLDWSKLSFGTDTAKPLALKFTDGAKATGMSADVRYGEAGCSVTIDKDGGDWVCAQGFRPGMGAASRTTFYHRSGSMDVSNGNSSWFCLGDGANGTNEFYMTGGTITAHGWFLIGGNQSCTEGRNYFEISGGTFTKQDNQGVFIGYKSGGHNELCVKTGGTFHTTKYVAVGQDSYGKGILTVDGGEVLADEYVSLGRASGVEGIVSIKGGRLTTKYINYGGSGTGKVFFNGGILRAAADNTTLIQANDNLYVYVGANGGTIDANGKTVTISEPLLEDAQSTGGGMTFKGGGSIAIADGNTYTGVTTVEVGTALSVPAPIAGDKLAFAIPAGLADGVYAVVSVTGDAAFAADVLDDATKPAEAEFVLSADGKTIYCIYGNVENSWTGGTAGVLTDPESWVLRRVPGNGETAVISSAAAATLTIPEGSMFAPSVIVFPAGSAAVTIAGEGTIGGIVAVTNLSSSVQTITCTLAFADAYRVHCASAAVNFSGGATATCPAADNTDNAASRALTGEITFTDDWTATGSMSSCYTVPNGSRLCGKAITGGLTNTTILRVEAGGYAEVDSVLTGNTYGRVSVRGEMVVNGVWVIAGTANDFVGAEGDQNYSGVLRAGGIWKGDATHEMSHYVFVKIPAIYVGNQGFGAKRQDFHFQFEGNNTVYATDDFEMFGVQRTLAGYEWDWGFCRYGNGNTTIDTRGYTVMWTGGAQGGGGIIKSGEGTLVMNPYGTSMTGAFTVNCGTLQLAKTGATGTGAVTVKDGAALAVSGTEAIELGGDLTLEDGAVLAFELTQRSAVPQLAIAEGKSVTANGTVKVKVSATCPWPTGGEKQITTGGGFAGANVALAEGSPKWAKGVSVVGGNIVLAVKPQGTIVILR